MFNLQKYLGYIVLVGFVVIAVEANDIDDLKTKYVNYIMECSQQFPISQEELEMLRNKQMPNTKGVKCIFACAYRKAGITDSKGYLAVDKVYAMSEKYLAEDAGKLKKAKQFADACRSVNNVNLGEHGNNECERAALIFKCSLEKASQFDFIA